MHKRAFTLVELLVVITIIGILVTLTTVTVLPIQRKSRDAKRKADLNLTLSGLNLFQSDFKIYPNPTFYLGNYDAAAVGDENSKYALGADIPACNNLTAGDSAAFTSTSTDPDTATLNSTAITMKPGFVAVNHFLTCLKYMDRILQDINMIGVNRYQYRVSYDYSEILLAATLENSADPDNKTLFDTTAPKRFYLGNGSNSRQLDDDTNITLKFFTLTFPGGPGVTTAGTNLDGRYFYQCETNNAATPATITRDNKATIPPIVSSGSEWVGNTTGTAGTVCSASQEDANTVVGSN